MTLYNRIQKDLDDAVVRQMEVEKAAKVVSQTLQDIESPGVTEPE